MLKGSKLISPWWNAAEFQTRSSFYGCPRYMKEWRRSNKQVAQWATIAHNEASIMFGDTIIYDAQRQVTLNLKQ